MIILALWLCSGFFVFLQFLPPTLPEFHAGWENEGERAVFVFFLAVVLGEMTVWGEVAILTRKGQLYPHCGRFSPGGCGGEMSLRLTSAGKGEIKMANFVK